MMGDNMDAGQMMTRQDYMRLTAAIERLNEILQPPIRQEFQEQHALSIGQEHDDEFDDESKSFEILNPSVLTSTPEDSDTFPKATYPSVDAADSKQSVSGSIGADSNRCQIGLMTAILDRLDRYEANSEEDKQSTQSMLKDYHNIVAQLKQDKDEFVKTMSGQLREVLVDVRETNEKVQAVTDRMQNLQNNFDRELERQNSDKEETDKRLCSLQNKNTEIISQNAEVVEKAVNKIVANINHLQASLEGALDEKAELFKKRTQDVETRTDTKLQEAQAGMKNRIDEAMGYIAQKIDSLENTSANIKIDIAHACEQAAEETRQFVESKVQEARADIQGHVNETVEDIVQRVVTKKGCQTAEETREFSDEHLQVSSTELQSDDDMAQPVDEHEELTTKLTKSLSSTTEEAEETELKDTLDDMKSESFRAGNETTTVASREPEYVSNETFACPLPSQKHYTFDMLIEDFTTWMNSGECFYGPAWPINQLDLYLQGKAFFFTNGTMNVWVAHGRFPQTTELQPLNGVRLRIKATVMDASGKRQELVNGEKIIKPGEKGIPANSALEQKLGIVSCNELIQNGFHKHEDHSNGAVLIRYHVEILD